MRAAVERLAAHVRRWLTGNADRQQHLAFKRALSHAMVTVVRAVERLVGTDVQAMRAMKHTLAPGPQELAVAIEHHHRVLATVEDVDTVLAVHRHCGDIRERPAFGNVGPVFDDIVLEDAAA